MKFREIVITIVIDDRKLTEYALNLDNPKGKNKAIMFEKHLGFTKHNYLFLKEQIKQKVLDAEATLQKIDIHVTRYRVDLEIEGLKPGQQETVRTGWIVNQNSDMARLVTLYVKKRK